ncbi:MAG: DUF262 domain-containing protein [Christensenellaceae bacterium]|jgi:hypothetical protein|nr:DUF262 domain-containing protein [Christensenellaceae bacterium]
METQHALIKIKALLDEIKYNLKVDIQRDFVYSQTQQQNVIESLLRNNSLGELKMWIVGNTYDVIDGKQRITAIRRFIINMFELTTKEVWTSLSPQMQEKILDTNIAIAIQSGTFDEKVKSFKLTNTAEKVHPFEELYALYNKSWLTELKYIGETNSAFCKVFGSYERGNNIMRLLKIHNLLDPNGMLRENAIIDFAEFWRNLSYYIDKTLFLFGKYPYDMTVLYELVINNKERAEKLEPDIPKLLLNKKNGVFKLNEDSLDTYYGNILGIYLPKDSRRLFTPSQKEKLFEDEKFRDGTPSDRSFDEYETNHIIRWEDGGRTTISNGELVLPIENKTICNNT